MANIHDLSLSLSLRSCSSTISLFKLLVLQSQVQLFTIEIELLPVHKLS